MIIQFKEDYRKRRELEYPTPGELADALYWQAKGDNTKMEAYVAKCDAVKSKIPKPVNNEIIP